MGEISKTAKASMVKEVKKAEKVESTEEAIRQIRIDRQASPKLAILREDRIDKLLAAYDAAYKAATEMAQQVAGLEIEKSQIERVALGLKEQLAASQTLNDPLHIAVMIDAFEEGHTYKVSRIHDEITILPFEESASVSPVSLDTLSIISEAGHSGE